MTVFLIILAVVIALIIGSRSGFEAGYRSGVLDTISLYRVLYKKAELQREDDKAGD